MGEYSGGKFMEITSKQLIIIFKHRGILIINACFLFKAQCNNLHHDISIAIKKGKHDHE